MSSNNYLEIFKSYRLLLIADTVDPVGGYSINTLVGNRILRGSVPHNITFPQMTIDISLNGNIEGLPYIDFVATFFVWYEHTYTNAANLSAYASNRLIQLLHKKQDDLNAINSNITFRLIDFYSNDSFTDEKCLGHEVVFIGTISTVN